jgi:hypothetical protein
MFAVSLVFGSFLTVLFLVVGLIGWLDCQRIYDELSGDSKTSPRDV